MAAGAAGGGSQLGGEPGESAGQGRESSTSASGTKIEPMFGTSAGLAALAGKIGQPLGGKPE